MPTKQPGLNTPMADLSELEARLRGGDTEAAAELFLACEKRLKKIVQLRLDRRLKGQIEASDVLQEAFLDIRRKAPEFAFKKNMPAFIWMRLITTERLLILHRKHLGRRPEVSLSHAESPADTTTTALANMLLGRLTSPSNAAIRAERRRKLHAALNAMDPTDREVLALRHFEELSNNETAAALGLTKTAASNRYMRALKRLKEILSEFPGLGPDEPVS